MQETNTNQQIPGEDSPAVLAYRVGQLEKSTAAGFKTLGEKLDKMSCTFVTFKDLENALTNADIIHKELQEEIESVKRQKWVQNTLSAIFGATLTILLSFAITSAIK